MIEAVGRALHDVAPVLLQLFGASAVLLAAAAGAARLLRSASAAVRHLVWAAALCALLVLPLASLALPDIPLRVLDAESLGISLTATSSVDRSALVPAGPRATDVKSAVAHSIPNAAESTTISPLGATEPTNLAPLSTWSWRAWGVALWGCITILLLTSAVRARVRLRCLASGARGMADPAILRTSRRIARTLGVRRDVVLLTTPDVVLPLTWGSRTPVVLLPIEAMRWPAERRDAVLAHELAHVARGDALGHEVARLVAALYWVNPLVWIALRAIRAERERACDDLVLATGARASSYAGDLLEIARTALGRRPVAAAALAMARPTELEGRLLAILDPRMSRRPATRGARTAAAVLVLALAIPLGALRPAERQAVAPRTSGAQVRLRGEPSGPSFVRSQASVPGAFASEVHSRDVDVSSGASIAQPSQPPTADANAKLRRMLDPSMPRAAEIVPILPTDAPLVLGARSWEVAPAAQSPASDADLETLIAVARAAGGLSSDHEKAELLMAVIARAVHDERLQQMLLGSAATISSGHQRHRVLLAMLRGGLVSGAEAPFLGAIEGIAGTHERSAMLVAFAGAHGFRDRDMRRAYLRVAGSLTSGYERAQAMRPVVEAPGFDAEAALDLLPALRGLTSHETANLLVAIARSGQLDDAAVRAAYLEAAAMLSSASDYRRVLQAAGSGGNRRSQ